MSQKLVYLMFVVLVLCFYMMSPARAATIIWVSDDKNHNSVVPTGAADQGWVDLLRTHGYTVDYRGEDGSTDRRHWRDMNDAKVAELNAADLVIVSRDISSGSYDQPDAAFWNAVTTPLILQIAHVARSGDEWFWLPGSGTSARFNPLEAVVPGHDIFDGVSLDGTNQVDILITKGSTDLRVDVVSNATDAGNGTVLAKTGDKLVWIATWEAGQEFYAGSGQTAGGPRMWFAGGSTDSQDGEYNFNAEGEKLFINAVRYMLGETATPRQAFEPNPADQATDVPRDMILSWQPGEFAPPINGHKVYFGESFDNVNDATGGVTQTAASYAPAQRLDFGTTYYWRVDEVNAPPDSTIFKGDIWSFTTEPIAYAVENITAMASSSDTAKGPENTVNGSGLDDGGLLHDNEGVNTMWLSSRDETQPTWIEYEFDNVYKLHEMWVWNSNESLEPMIGLGFKDVSIDYSVNGTDYTTLGTTHEFARAPGASDYAHNTTVNFSGVAAKYVRLTANSNWGGFLNQYGLSEVRFFSIPVFAREPSPDSGATDVALDLVLSFRAGREAAVHDVYFSDDWQAVVDGTTPVTTVTETSHGPVALDLGTTYYWRVDEVNDTETPTTWQGDVWNFRTHEYFVVDDFEDYNDYPPDEIFSTWIDGYGTTTNGSTAGYAEPDFLAGEHYIETSVVHGGSQSMPLFYDNNFKYSEATMTLVSGRDWTRRGVGVLSLWFCGDASNAAVRMYVALNGNAVVYHDNPDAALIDEWTQWTIDLQEFAAQGVNLANVNTIAIGFGDKNNLQAGGSGMVFFDDIRLYRPAP